MPPSADREAASQGDPANPTNPFVTFRRFADEQLASLFTKISDISSTYSPPKSTRDYDDWLPEAHDSRQRMNRETNEAERIMDVYVRAYRDTAGTSAGHPQELAGEDQGGAQRCPYAPFDLQAPGPKEPSIGAFHFMNDGPVALSLAVLAAKLPTSVLDTQILGEQVPSVTVAYLLQSPYSPLRLKTQHLSRNHGMQWREAFEDLLTVQNGKTILPRRLDDSAASDLDWLTGMIRMAMLNREHMMPSQIIYKPSAALSENVTFFRRFSNTSQPKSNAHCVQDKNEDKLGDEEDSDEDYLTELDPYDMFLDSQQSPAAGTVGMTAGSIKHPHRGSSANLNDNKKPDVLSTLTTTERTALQDGTIHTKVVLKKRFSDGREQSSETVHTQHGQAKQMTQSTPKVIDGKATVNGEEIGAKKSGKETNNKKGGWFWF